jgi:DNA-binding transcriptional ArsR family regulator
MPADAIGRVGASRRLIGQDLAMAEDLLERIRREIRERRQAAQAAHEESRRLERALAALRYEPPAASRLVDDAPRRQQRSAPRRPRAAPGANREAILAVVHERPGVTAGEIAQVTGIPRSAVSPALSRLAGGGAVERTPLPGGGVGFRVGREPGGRAFADAPDRADVTAAAESAPRRE